METEILSLDRAAIQRIREDWDAAWRDGDASRLAGLYSEDAVLMPQNAPEVVGRDAIRATYQAVFEVYAIAGGGMLQETEIAGEWAFFRSTYNVTAAPRDGGPPMHDRGKWLCILRRQADGSWKIARLIANSDLPPAS